MSKVITISDTDKTGWIRFLVKDAGQIINDIYVKKLDIYQISKKTKDTDVFVSLCILNKTNPVFLTHDVDSTKFDVVDFVNTIPPTSLQDLQEKILSLLPNS